MRGTNGYHEPTSSGEAERELVGRPLSVGYKPSLSSTYLLGDDPAGYWGTMQSVLRDAEAMLRHPRVALPLEYYKSGIASAKFTVKAPSKEIAKFAHGTLSRFWERSLTQAQMSYDYGWAGYEVAYRLQRGRLEYDGLHHLHPFDVWAVTDRGAYRGFSVQGTLDYRGRGLNGKLFLWGPTHWPAKGLWLSHNLRFSRYYGQSQLYGAWKPWRRLAGRDAAEEVIDGGVYRFAYKGPVMRYPAKAFRKADNSLDYDAAREKAREFTEQAKAGVSIALPNTRDQQGNLEWELEWPDHTINVDGLLKYQETLQKDIAYGLGVPPELLEASEVGSGWSGRAIPLVGFFQGQLKNARTLVRQFQWQVIDPLLRWNYGPKAWCEVEVEVELPKGLAPKDQGQGAPPPGPGGAPGGAPPAPGGEAGAGGGGGGDLASLLAGTAGGGSGGGTQLSTLSGTGGRAVRAVVATTGRNGGLVFRKEYRRTRPRPAVTLSTEAEESVSPGEALAKAYAAFWNGRKGTHAVTDAEVEEAGRQLGGGGWEVAEEGGRWEPVRCLFEDEDGGGPGGYELAVDAGEWVADGGKSGRTDRWRNTRTKEVRYQKSKPGTGRSTGAKTPAAAPKPAARPKVDVDRAHEAIKAVLADPSRLTPGGAEQAFAKISDGLGGATVPVLDELRKRMGYGSMPRKKADLVAALARKLLGADPEAKLGLAEPGAGGAKAKAKAPAKAGPDLDSLAEKVREGGDGLQDALDELSLPQLRELRERVGGEAGGVKRADVTARILDVSGGGKKGPQGQGQVAAPQEEKQQEAPAPEPEAATAPAPQAKPSAFSRAAAIASKMSDAQYAKYAQKIGAPPYDTKGELSPTGHLAQFFESQDRAEAEVEAAPKPATAPKARRKPAVKEPPKSAAGADDEGAPLLAVADDAGEAPQGKSSDPGSYESMAGDLSKIPGMQGVASSLGRTLKQHPGDFGRALKALADADVAVFDPIVNGGRGKVHGIFHNEFLRSMSNAWSDWERSRKDATQGQATSERLLRIAAQLKDRVIPGVRSLADSGETFENEQGPIDLKGAADFYEGHVLPLIDGMLAKVGHTGEAARRYGDREYLYQLKDGKVVGEPAERAFERHDWERRAEEAETSAAAEPESSRADKKPERLDLTEGSDSETEKKSPPADPKLAAEEAKRSLGDLLSRSYDAPGDGGHPRDGFIDKSTAESIDSAMMRADAGEKTPLSHFADRVAAYKAKRVYFPDDESHAAVDRFVGSVLGTYSDDEVKQALDAGKLPGLVRTPKKGGGYELKYRGLIDQQTPAYAKFLRDRVGATSEGAPTPGAKSEPAAKAEPQAKSGAGPVEYEDPVAAMIHADVTAPPGRSALQNMNEAMDRLTPAQRQQVLDHYAAKNVPEMMDRISRDSLPYLQQGTVPPEPKRLGGNAEAKPEPAPAAPDPKAPRPPVAPKPGYALDPAKYAKLHGHEDAAEAFAAQSAEAKKAFEAGEPLNEAQRRLFSLGEFAPKKAGGDKPSASTAYHPGDSETATATPPSTPEARAKVLEAFGRVEGSGDNLVSLADLAKESGLSVPEMKAAVADLRREGKLSLSNAEGRDGISEEDRAHSIYEDLGSGGMTPMLYASKKEGARTPKISAEPAADDDLDLGGWGDEGDDRGPDGPLDLDDDGPGPAPTAAAPPPPSRDDLKSKLAALRRALAGRKNLDPHVVHDLNNRRFEEALERLPRLPEAQARAVARQLGAEMDWAATKAGEGFDAPAKGKGRTPVAPLDGKTASPQTVAKVRPRLESLLGGAKKEFRDAGPEASATFDRLVGKAKESLGKLTSTPGVTHKQINRAVAVLESAVEYQRAKLAGTAKPGPAESKKADAAASPPASGEGTKKAGKGVSWPEPAGEMRRPHPLESPREEVTRWMDAVRGGAASYLRSAGTDAAQILRGPRAEADARLAAFVKSVPQLKGLTTKEARQAVQQLADMETHPEFGELYPDGFTPPTYGNRPNAATPPGSRPRLAAGEAKACGAYSGVAYVSLNAALRAGKEPTGPDAAVHAGLKAAFAKAKPFARPVELHRSMNLHGASLDRFVEQAKEAHAGGGLIPADSYLSCTTEKQNTFGGNVALKITARKGLDMMPYSELPQETEVLLDHGSRFRVRSVTKGPKGDWEIHLEQVLPE